MYGWNAYEDFDELAERIKTSSHLSKELGSTNEASRKDASSPVLDETIPRTASEDDDATSTAEVGWEDFYFYDVYWGLGTGELDEKRWQYLPKDFELLLDSV